MSKEDMMLQGAADRVLSYQGEINRQVLQELIKTRTLSSIMEALNQQVLDGSPSERERARDAIRKLGFAAD